MLLLRQMMHGGQMCSMAAQVAVRHSFLSPVIPRYASTFLSDVPFDFSPYQCVGFDLDNTLCQYQVQPLMEMAYDQCLVPHLISRWQYPADVFAPMCDQLELCARGLILDTMRGNLLKLRHDGAVLRATHGSQPLTRAELVEAYGRGGAPAAARHLALSVADPPCGTLRSFRDYFDADGIAHMYARHQFAADDGGFFSRLRADTPALAHPCSAAVLRLLRQLRSQGKLLFLITSSHADYARHMARLALGGADWFDFFDVVVTYACKPRFFTGRAPFLALDAADREAAPVAGAALRPGRVYSQGSWAELYGLLQRQLGTERPACVYVGDNLAYDVHPARAYTRCHVVAVCEELEAEWGVRCASGAPTTVRHSRLWGSLLSEGDQDTLWGAVVRGAHGCVPRVDYLVPH
ncbi:5'-nucleotidase domain-containing protein 1-like [Pollicipes pollicipes]|uniref:5'-nucleotidase domain-containing protein 1-like n=1 Tax=Pollicipes pollicipes TaxID=41117 RepID=UPI001884D828|nr:5'-nucleotidase domain-containing protein 1-like [Pollicipes pollicipes]